MTNLDCAFYGTGRHDMTNEARILTPAARAYSGALSDPDRWAIWTPRPGDILVCTPPRSGTTWTQTMLVMLLNGGSDLHGKVPDLSPWIDASIGTPAEKVRKTLAAQEGRRVVKTHVPADGFPVWEGVTVISVYRHPLDVFFSRRKHIANRANVPPDHPMALPLPESFRFFLDSEAPSDDFDRDNLAMMTTHFRETACSGRLPDLKLFHYSHMVRDGQRTVAELARAADIDADASLVAEVAEATAFGAMKAKAAKYTPYAGSGLWKSDASFFDSASSRKWEGKLSEEELSLFDERLAELLPDDRARAWFESGEGSFS